VKRLPNAGLRPLKDPTAEDEAPLTSEKVMSDDRTHTGEPAESVCSVHCVDAPTSTRSDAQVMTVEVRVPMTLSVVEPVTGAVAEMDTLPDTAAAVYWKVYELETPAAELTEPTVPAEAVSANESGKETT